MANSLLVTNEQAENRATILKTSLADSLLRLLQNYTPTATDNRTVLLANEANFTGYTNGGYNLGVWTGPALLGTGGAAITSGIAVVAPAANNAIQNNLTGFWIETAGNTPVTLLTGILSPGIPVLTPLDQFPIVVQDIEGVTVG